MTTKPKTGKRGKAARKKIAARITYLEMDHPPARHIPVPTRPTIALMKTQFISAEYYRFLYEMVGKPHHWEERRDMDDAELYAVINDDDCEIHALYADGCPAGFFELNLAEFPESISIAYFGLGVEYQGLGLGKWFLSSAVSAAWSHKPAKIKVQTNTLDHPAALPMYQKLGFSPVGIGEEQITPWD